MNRKTLICALFMLALGGGLLHYRIHPLFKFSYSLASIFSLIDITLITPLFFSRKTVLYGLLLKGIFAIFAVIFMGHFSIVSFVGKNPKFYDWIFKSTLADILIAVAGFLIAKAIYDSYFMVQESIKHFPIPLRKS